MLPLLGQGGCDLESYIRKPPNVLLLEELTFSTFHIITLVIFLLAIIHTFLANRITRYAENVEEKHFSKNGKEKGKDVSFAAEILYFFGEVEVIFGLWVIPLFAVIALFHNWKTALEYINTRDYTEPLFVVVIMALASTRPIVRLAEGTMRKVAYLFGGTIQGWWLSILIIGPLMGSFITEAGAMTLSAMLLARQFYIYKPSRKLAYATLGLLFVNISVGGVLTNFAAPPVLIISKCWNWSSLYMFRHFGLKAIAGVIVSSVVYWLFFRKEFREIERTSGEKHREKEKEQVQKVPIPLWVTCVHLIFIVWTVINAHYPAIFIASFLLFLGFVRATKPHQFATNIKKPLLVGFFLAGLIIHGGLQGWWVTPLMSEFSHTGVMVLGVILTAFNDNAAVAYLTSLIPNWGEVYKYAIISGVVTGGGLTVIANAPNPAGYVLLQDYFKKGISPLFLFLSALVPTIIFFIFFYLPFLIGTYPK